MSRLSQGEKIAGGSALLLLILSLLPFWAKYEAGPLSESFSGWSDAYNFIWVRLPLVLALVMVVVVVIRATGSNMSMPVAPGMIYVGLGGLTALLLLLAILTGPRDFGLAGLGGLEVSRGIGLFVGFILGLAMAAGGYMHMQEEGSSSAPGPVTPPPPSAPPPPAS